MGRFTLKTMCADNTFVLQLTADKALNAGLVLMTEHFCIATYLSVK